MRRDIQKRDVIEAEIIDSWQNPDRVSLTRAQLRDLQANRTGWMILAVCGGLLLVLIPIWIIGMTTKPEPSIMPSCESNCTIYDTL